MNQAITYGYLCCRRVFTHDIRGGRGSLEETNGSPMLQANRRRIVRHRCSRCTRRLQLQRERQGDAVAQEEERANALLEYFRGELLFPRMNIALQIAQLVPMPQSRFSTAPQGSGQTQGASRGLDDQRSPMSFFAWVSLNMGNEDIDPEESLGNNVISYLRYLSGFQNIEHHNLFFHAMNVLSTTGKIIEFEPVDPSGQLMSFTRFLHGAGQATLNATAHLSIKYARYLMNQGSLEHVHQFMDSRARLAERVHRIIDLMTCVDRSSNSAEGATPLELIEDDVWPLAGEDDVDVRFEGQLLLFNDWVELVRRTYDINPFPPTQLQRDLDLYENEYLRPRISHARDILFEFSRLRQSIELNEIRTFEFVTHTPHIANFKNWYARNLPLQWHQALERYSEYLKQSGSPQLADRFQEARIGQALADRRDYGGHLRERRETRVFPNPTTASADQLTDLFNGEVRRLGSLAVRAPGIRFAAVTRLEDLIRRHGVTTLAGRSRTLEGWDDIRQGLEAVRVLLVEHDVAGANPPNVDQQPSSLSTSPSTISVLSDISEGSTDVDFEVTDHEFPSLDSISGVRLDAENLDGSRSPTGTRSIEAQSLLYFIKRRRQFIEDRNAKRAGRHQPSLRQITPPPGDSSSDEEMVEADDLMDWSWFSERNCSDTSIVYEDDVSGGVE